MGKDGYSGLIAQTDEELEEVEETWFEQAAHKPVETKFKATTVDGAILAFSRLFDHGGDHTLNDKISFVVMIVLNWFSLFMQLTFLVIFRIYQLEDQVDAHSGPDWDSTRASIEAASAAAEQGSSMAGDVIQKGLDFCKSEGDEGIIVFVMIFFWTTAVSPVLWDRIWHFINIFNMTNDHDEWIELARPAPESKEFDAVDDQNEEVRPKELVLHTTKETTNDTTLFITRNGVSTKPSNDCKPPTVVYGKGGITDYLKPASDKDEARWITYMSTPVKIALTLLVLMPDYIVYLYALITGCKFLIFTGDMAVLLIKALTLKSIITLPTYIFGVFTENSVKKYVSHSGMKIIINNKTKWYINWNCWIGPIYKFVIAALFAFLVWFVIFSEMRSVRAMCVELFELNPGVEDCKGNQLPCNTCGYGQVNNCATA
jgi:hypothetical protein